MATLFAHFYNEEYMLPWWIKHHSRLFESAILIDNNSNDTSVEIIKDMAPNWKVYPSFRKDFNSALTDLEVQYYEKDVSGWKVCLNISEFLVVPGRVEEITNAVDINFPGNRAIGIPGVIMVDDKPTEQPKKNECLLAQKTNGFVELENRALLKSVGMSPVPSRTRYLHKALIGHYTPGRHGSHIPDRISVTPNVAQIRWFGFSPWTQDFKLRKLQIGATLDPHDVRVGWGLQHLMQSEELEKRREALLSATGKVPLPAASS